MLRDWDNFHVRCGSNIFKERDAFNSDLLRRVKVKPIERDRETPRNIKEQKWKTANTINENRLITQMDAIE